MNIKKLIACAAAALTLPLLSGCSVLDTLISPDPFYENRRDLDTDLTNELIESLNTRNKSAVKDKFSFYAVNYLSDFDRKLDNLFDFVNEEITSFTYDAGADEASWDYGTHSRYLTFDLTLSTRTRSVNMTVAWYPVNDYDENYEGICFMYFGESKMYDLMPENVTEADGTEHSCCEPMQFGLYMEGEKFYRETQQEIISQYTAAVYESFTANDADLLARQFCKRAQNNLSEDIRKFFEYIPDAKYVKEQPYAMDKGEHADFPYPSADRYILEMDGGIVKEYWLGIADLENDDYILAFVYCLRDDVSPDFAGLDGILFYPSEEYRDINTESLADFICGIYTGDETLKFRTA